MRIEISDINDGLTARIETLAREILSNGYADGAFWRCGDIHNTPPGKAGTLTVHLSGRYQGWWKDWAGDDRLRDPLDLVAFGLFGGDKKQAYRWAVAWLGLDTGDTESALKKQRAAAEARRRTAAASDETNRRKRRQALALFLKAEPITPGSPVDLYLQHRGIDFRKVGRIPKCLRFHPHCWNTEADRGLPAMVAAISGPEDPQAPDGKHGTVAVHRTWLEIAGGRVTKARLRKPKMVLGPYAGGMIRLWRGTVTDPETGEVKPGPKLQGLKDGDHALTVSEGIEDGLSCVMVRPEEPAAAAIALGNIGSAWLPAGIRRVTLASQNDTAPEAIESYRRQVAALQARGLQVFDGRPPADFKDINDYYRHLLQLKEDAA